MPSVYEPLGHCLGSRLLVEWLDLEFPDWIATSVLNRDLTHAPVLSMTIGLGARVYRHRRPGEVRSQALPITLSGSISALETVFP